MGRFRFGLTLALACALATPAVAVSITFTDNFTAAPGTIDPAWSIVTAQNDASAGVLGYMATGTATLTFNSPGQSVPLGGTLQFTVLGGNTVDGWSTADSDFSRLRVNGTTLLNGAWNLNGGGSDFLDINPNGATFSHSVGNIVDVTVPFTMLSGTNTFEFRYLLNESFENERWALDNVSILAEVPEPVSISVSFAMATAGLLATRQRRRRQSA